MVTVTVNPKSSSISQSNTSLLSNAPNLAPLSYNRDIHTDDKSNSGSGGGGEASFNVLDPYDPARPNDYLLWCEERLEKKRLTQLAEENRCDVNCFVNLLICYT